MPKKTIELLHEGVDYINRDGLPASADFRHTDNKEAWVRKTASNVERGTASEKPVRVYRISTEGERLLARFRGSSARKDAEEYAASRRQAYAVDGFYTVEVR